MILIFSDSFELLDMTNDGKSHLNQSELAPKEANEYRIKVEVLGLLKNKKIKY